MSTIDSLKDIAADLQKGLDQRGNVGRAYTSTARNNLLRIIKELQDNEARELAAFHERARQFNEQLRKENEAYQRHCESHQ